MTQPVSIGDTITMITAAREQQLIEAANLLTDARRTHTPIADLPTDLQPTDLEEAARIHSQIALSFGEIGGWKIGATSPESTPFFAPMPRAWMAPSPATLVGPTYRYRGLEAEIAFLLANDLPPRATPYTRAEVLAAVASCHPILEELESALIDPLAAHRLTYLADLQMHGGLIHGPSVSNWQSIDFSQETVTLTVDGVVRVERTGSNTSGDLLGLLPYLANQGATRTGGLRAGQWITTGSWTGNTPADSQSAATAAFTHAGSATLRFA
ncbi:MAG TPA: 2-keto-4-pentenoate hydratase [Acidobacteriaceae bacterium]|nr:2-keto-4-pentenoate hydratase [Acidobacteriaceae bacterium]